MKRPNCQARQHSDQMLCGHCGFAWDVNDPDPPECRNSIEAPPAPVENAPGKLPYSLPVELAAEMDKAYQANACGGDRGRIRGMQAAYRIFLDRVEP